MLKTVEEMLGLNYQDAWVHGERRYSNSFKKRMRQNVEWLSLVQTATEWTGLSGLVPSLLAQRIWSFFNIQAR